MKPIPRLPLPSSPAPGALAGGAACWLLALAALPCAAQVDTVTPVTPGAPVAAVAQADPGTTGADTPPAMPAAAPAPLKVDRRVARPLWEIGLGLGALNWPDYRGAAHSQTYVVPLPYVVYRGRFLRADRGGARAVLVENQRLEIDLSLSGSVPVRNQAGGVREGMADLPSTFEVGPNVNLMLWRSADNRNTLELRLPVRAAIALQSPLRSIGLISTPKLNLDLHQLAGWNVGLLAGPVFGSRRYHEHYYGVRASEATAGRPAYEARSGYAGWHAIASASRRFDRFWVGTYVRHDQLQGAVFADSPLVQRTRNWSAGIGLAWVLASSQDQVLVDER
ncbi:outer membrane scaffolding protein for murein synthesis (MipA/OmpV family) [Sphaerotilus hippei]|uniref:Outer membrane scaffolding protein for murein synthesis (MipA/OmpV family) n=1 Tax=Sphaerotilus hippei TaxID=744406 RepID=A0A318H478_9BURK|nr:MipA/OmpV family protein [Sphaerotilus hippei]PXW96646.1 outer membrane scaffolding protein for murein synthesis (MipA/OmpV family) [Sphaerotilus hippei]